MTGENNPQPITAPFQLEVNYAYKDKESRNEYFLIDVVSIDMLSAFLAEHISKADVPTISEHLAWEERMSRRQNQFSPED